MPGPTTRPYGVGAPIELIAMELEKLDLSFVDWPRLQSDAARSDRGQAAAHR